MNADGDGDVSLLLSSDDCGALSRVKPGATMPALTLRRTAIRSSSHRRKATDGGSVVKSHLGAPRPAPDHTAFSSVWATPKQLLECAGIPQGAQIEPRARSARS